MRVFRIDRNSDHFSIDFSELFSSITEGNNFSGANEREVTEQKQIWINNTKQFQNVEIIDGDRLERLKTKCCEVS
jgi:hypothetical protein